MTPSCLRHELCLIWVHIKTDKDNLDRRNHDLCKSCTESIPSRIKAVIKYQFLQESKQWWNKWIFSGAIITF